MKRFEKAARVYKTAAILLLNTVVMFIILNLICAAILAIYDRSLAKNPVRQKYGERVQQAHPGMTSAQLNKLLSETWTRTVIYDPFDQFRERPFTGKYVNVSAEGTRRFKNKGPWPPDPANYNIFVFGGSTTFGYGVADDQTIPSYLQETLTTATALPVRVYNFGCHSYYSSQERACFEKLITTGTIPQAAIFIDGLNEFVFHQDIPQYTDDLADCMEQKDSNKKALNIASKLALIRALGALVIPESLESKAKQTAELSPEHENVLHDAVTIDRVIQHYIRNKRVIESIAAVHGVKTIFVWQPIPAYKYDMKHHLFPEGARYMYSTYGYPRMAEIIAQKPLGNNFVWAADIQENLKEPLYVDKVHYNPEMHRRIATFIADEITRRGLLTASATPGTFQ